MFFAGQIAFEVDQALGGAGGHDAAAACARRTERAARPFPAAHGQDYGAGLKLLQAVFRADRGDQAAGCQFQDHCAALPGDSPVHDCLDVTGGIFRSGQLFFETVQAEAVVNALR